jgi:surface antigen
MELDVREVDVAALRVLTCKDTTDRWLLALAQSGFATTGGPPGSPQARMAELYQLVQDRVRLDDTLTVARTEHPNSSPSHPLMWLVPPGLFMLAITLGATQDDDISKLVVAGSVLAGAGGLAVLVLLIRKAMQARTSFQKDAVKRVGGVQKRELGDALESARDALLDHAWAAQSGDRVLVYRGPGDPVFWSEESQVFEGDVVAAWHASEDDL